MKRYMEEEKNRSKMRVKDKVGALLNKRIDQLAAVGSGVGAAGRKMSILENSINDIHKNVGKLRLMDYFN